LRTLLRCPPQEGSTSSPAEEADLAVDPELRLHQLRLSPLLLLHRLDASFLHQVEQDRRAVDRYGAGLRSDGPSVVRRSSAGTELDEFADRQFFQGLGGAGEPDLTQVGGILAAATGLSQHRGEHARMAR
jgi:hypothetical protein